MADVSTEPDRPPFSDYPGFHGWVAHRLGRTLDGHGWLEMLLDACDGDEEAALDRFWIELEAYRAAG
jgi:hypothetical protein